MTLQLPAEVWGLLQRAMEGARRASEASLSDAEALAAVAREALAHQHTDVNSADPRHTVVLYECPSCARTELDTGAGAVELGAGAAATLGCGARVRDLRTEGREVRRGGPLPAAIERAVRLRDRNTCRVPGCCRRRYVDVHHITFQSEGGEHSRSNCVCLCTTHHGLLHDGHLRIEGDAEGELSFREKTGALLSPPVVSHSGTSGFSVAASRGMPPPAASNRAMSAAAASHSGTSTPAASNRTMSTPAASHGGASSVSTASHSGTSLVLEAGASDMAATLLALLDQRGGWSVDALVDASGLRAGEVQGVLLGLELDGCIENDGFGSYARCAGRA